jgi:hypothetical protein
MSKKQPALPSTLVPLNKRGYSFCESDKEWRKRNVEAYFRGTYIEDRDAPIPGVPCLTGLFVIANSPR